MAATPNKYLRENEEMRTHIAQLKRDLEQEKNAVKQAHRDKVAEVKGVREEAAARHRKEMGLQLDKVRRDARSENQEMERTFKQQLQLELHQKHKAHEEEINTLKEKWNRERSEIQTKMKAKIKAETVAEETKKFEMMRKQMTTEMFRMDSARNEAEEKANTLAAADQKKAEEIRKQAEMHRAELDKIQREAQRIANQHREEMKNKDRELASKNKEMMILGEKVARVESERDELQDSVHRYKQGESFTKMTPRSPSIGIGDKSFEEVTAPTISPKVYSEHEKELIIRNSELTFRIKEVEKHNQMLKKTKEDLEHTVDHLKDATKPLEEKNKKLFQRCIDMQGAKQRQELRNKQLLSDIDDLKSRNESLEKENARQRRNIAHMLGESGSSRDAMSSVKAQNERLKTENRELNEEIRTANHRTSELQLKLERFQKMNRKLKQKTAELEKARLPVSPEPISVLLDASSRSQSFSDLATVEEESHCSILQDELEQVTFDRVEMEAKYGMLENEKLKLEKEHDSLKQQLLGGGYDTQRQEAKIQQLQRERDEAQTKLQKMEDELLSLAQSDGADRSAKVLEERAKQEAELAERHKLETKLTQTEAKLLAAQAEHNHQEEQLLQQVQDLSGELEYSREQHRVETTRLNEELIRQKVQSKVIEEAESKVTQLQQELQQQLQEREAALRKNSNEMATMKQYHLAEVSQLNEAIKTAEDEASNTLDALQHKVSDVESSLAIANEQVFNLTREKAGMEATLQEELRQVKEALEQAKSNNIAEQETWKENFAGKLKAQHAVTIDELAAEHRATVNRLEEQQTVIAAELAESQMKLQEIADTLAGKGNELAELTTKSLHSEKHVLNVRKILQEAPALMIQGDTVVTDSITGRTLNDVVKDLISEVDDGTLTTLVRESTTQASNVLMTKRNEEEHNRQLMDNMQRELDELKQERDQLRQRYDQLGVRTNGEHDGLKERNIQLEQQVEHMSQEHDQLKERRDQLEQQLDQLSQEQHQSTERCSELEDQVGQMNHVHADIKQRHDELQKQNSQLKEETDGLKAELNARDQMTQQIEARFKEQLQEDSKVLAIVQEQLHTSEHSLQNALQQADVKNSQLKTSQTRCQVLESNLQETKTRNHHLQEQCDKLWNEQMALQKDLSEISETVEQLNTSSQLKDDEISMLRLQAQQQKKRPQLTTPSIVNHTGVSSRAQQQRLFVAILDYNPQSFCQTGHPERELQLQAGDIVKVVGEMTSEGFYYTLFNNKQGLVPANFLEEMNIKNTVVMRRLHNQSLSSLTNGDMSTDSTADISRHHSSVGDLHPQSPAPPTELRVERVLKRALMIAWSIPNITALGQSNGIKVQGYQIFIDGVLYSSVQGCYQSKALIGSTDVDKPHIIAVATFALNGAVSSKCQIQYKPIHVSRDYSSTLNGSVASHEHQSPLNFPHVQTYQLMKVLQSPTPSSSQLRLQEGDIIKVFGRLRKDGNYVAEVHGNQVLIPGYLLSPVVSDVIV